MKHSKILLLCELCTTLIQIVQSIGFKAIEIKKTKWHSKVRSIRSCYTFFSLTCTRHDLTTQHESFPTYKHTGFNDI